MKRLKYLTLAAVVAFAACDTEEIVYLEGAADTVEVYVERQAWVGIAYTFANSDHLNSDVLDKIRAGWECEELLTLPYWLPQNKYHNEWALVTAHFYICHAPVPGIPVQPFAVPETIEDIFR